MDKYPLLWQGMCIGEMTMLQQGEETAFSLRCSLPEKGVWTLWAVGENGELRLGVPWNRGKEGVLDKRFSARMTQHLGRLLRAELRASDRMIKEDIRWCVLTGDVAFRTPWIAAQLSRQAGVLLACRGKERLIAVPYDAAKPFPLMPMFCFACLRQIGTQHYLVLCLNEREQPVFV